MRIQTLSSKKYLWKKMRLTLRRKIVQSVRGIATRYIVRRLDNGKPVSGTLLCFLDRRLSRSVNRYDGALLTMRTAAATCSVQ